MAKYKILQLKENIPSFRNKIFMSWDIVEGSFNINDYNLMYEGEIEMSNYYEALDELFTTFNIRHPKDFKGHSMSVSDVVIIDGITWYCDSLSWVNVSESQSKE